MARATYSARLPFAVGFTAIVLLVGGLGVWSMQTEITGAVIAPGVIVVENNRQVVQHSEGGIVGTIGARDGDTVAAGDVLIRLDDTFLRSELAVAEVQLVELQARRARLEAERDGEDAPVFSENYGSAEDRAAQVAGQVKLFEARRASLQQEAKQIVEQIAQTRNQIAGTEAQLQAQSLQERLVAEELSAAEDALEKGLIQKQRLTALQRDAARLAGDTGRLRANVARLRGEVAELEIARLQLFSDRREAAIAELRDIQFREFELVQQHRNLLERQARLEIRAPVGGVVYGSTIFAQKSVIQPADPLMYVIPQDAQLVVSARVAAIDIDQIFVGQPATLRFSAFNQRLTPEIAGEVTSVSADILEDAATGQTYYSVSIMPVEAELPKLENQNLVPGMPVETYLRTEDRTPLSYLTKPLTDYFGRAFRES